MKEFFLQLRTIWREMRAIQKGAFLCVLCFVVSFMGFLLVRSTSTAYVPLFPGRGLSATEMNEVRSYLEHFAIPFQEEEGKGLLVLSDHADQIRCSLAEEGLPKRDAGKGFELFDTNTWIKGERELQVLEMRALKGQLERDLATFEHIKSANVILDIPPQKAFNGQKYQTKASVILTLMPKARLSASELRAITNHLAGAIRGLEPNMIAVSDTTGKLYKAIDPEGAQDPLHDAGLLFEEHLEEKISALLTRLVGEEHFYTNVQAIFDRDSEAILSLSIAAVIDRGVLAEKEGGSFQTEIERQLKALAKGYGLSVDPVVDFIPFGQKSAAPVSGTRRFPLSVTFMLLASATAGVILWIFWRRRENNQRGDEGLFQMMTRVDLKKLAESIQHEDPKTIALMLSYLEPVRAEQLLATFKTELQEKILYHLSELEKEGR